MAPDSAKYLWDAIQAARRVERFAAGLSFEDYGADEVRRSAIERQLEILGEALNQPRKSDTNMALQIVDLPRAIALRKSTTQSYGV